MRFLRTTLLAALACVTTSAWAGDAPKTDAPKAKAEKTPGLPTGTLSAKDWLAAATTPLEAGELDRLVAADLEKAKIKPASRTTDEQFLRRVFLDVTGKLPPPAEIVAFVKDQAPDKRAKMIDKLLDSDDYARHWGLYWRDVIATRVTDGQARLFAPQFDSWIIQQFKENKSWAEMTRAMLTASGEMKYFGATETPNGAAFFLLSRRGADAVTERAAETSRVFLGIQIQCAQCHDHPFEAWKRPQFH